jgi:putative nucleotidyltransferase with HDIG domain
MRRAEREQVDSSVALLIGLVTAAAAAVTVATASTTAAVVAHRPRDCAVFLALALALQLFAIEVVGGGRIGVSAVAILASGVALGVGPAVAIAIVTALLNWLIHGRTLFHRGIFDIGNFAVSAAAAAAVVGAARWAGGDAGLVVGSLAAGTTYSLVNNALLCIAIGATIQKPAREIWDERFRWARWHYLAFGPLALACAVAYEQIGIPGLAAFAFPPALVLLSVRQYLDRTRALNEELQAANDELQQRVRDADDLYDFARGIAAQPHERTALSGYVEKALTSLLGSRVVVSDERVVIDEASDEERWQRLAPAVEVLLESAFENAKLAETVRRTHLATIAALSRTMEAKDGYTGGHTERVAVVAVALAERLGYTGGDLDAIEIGALLHDIGKIGIPERVLNKPGPLDADEWELMKRHPVISDTILSEVELPATVREIARWSHERLDGKGYPDGLAGDEIPLPARIVLVADAWDALTSDRSYRRARTTLEALHELRSNAGTQFCPRVVEALEELYLDMPGILGGRAVRVVENVA